MSLVYEWEYAPSSLVVYNRDRCRVYDQEVYPLHLIWIQNCGDITGNGTAILWNTFLQSYTTLL